MAIKVYGDKIVFPDSTEQTTAPTQLDGYTKPEMDDQQKIQDDRIQANEDAIQTNIDAIEVNKDAINAIPDAIDAYTKDETYNNVEIDGKLFTKADKETTYTKTEVDASQATQDAVINTKIEDAPIDGKEYTRKDAGWTELDTTDEGILDAPADGKTYGRKDEVWTEVVVDAYTEGDTDALLDGKADKADTYTKAEIDEQQLEQDAEITANTTDIADNATNIATNTADIATNATNIATNKTDIASNASAIASASTRVTENEHDIIELEEEIEALAPSFDRGHWEHDPVTGLSARAPIEGAYYLAGDSTQIVQTFKDTHQIYFNNIDSAEPPLTHTFDDVTEGMYIEMFEATDSSFFLGVVETVTKGVSHTVVDVTMVKAEGGPDVGDSSVRVKFFTLADAELELDGYITEAELNASQAVQDALIQANTDAIEGLPDIIDAYSKDEIDAQQTAQDDVIDTKADKGDSYLKAEADTLLDNKANVGDSYLKAESDTALDLKADKTTTYTKTEVDDSQALQDTEIAKKADKETTYTKEEVDASQKPQNDAIEAIQEEIAPWEPHGYLYVNNCVLSDEEGKRFDEFVGPKEGEIFFLGLGYFPVPNDNYTSINSILISKYDNKGKELPFEKVEVYNDEGEFVYTRYDVYDKFLKLVSPNGSANYKLEGLMPSTESPLIEELGYEGEEFYLLDLRTGESEKEGTIAEGEIVQVTSPEDPVVYDGYTKEEADALLDDKANVDDVYDKDDMDFYLNLKANTRDVIEEAPTNGKQYARKDAGWSEVEASEDDGGLEEAPYDNKQYARQNNAWSKIVGPSGNNEAIWGRMSDIAGNGNEWRRAREAVINWHNYEGNDAGEFGGMMSVVLDTKYFSTASVVKISSSSLTGTFGNDEVTGGPHHPVGANNYAEKFRALKAGDSIEVKTTDYGKNDTNIGGGLLKITGITEHAPAEENGWNSYFEFNVEVNSKLRGGIEKGDYVSVVLPEYPFEEVAPNNKDTYKHDLEIEGSLKLIKHPEPGQSSVYRVINNVGFCKDAGGASFVKLGATTNHGTMFYADDKQKMQISSNGNVYIGGEMVSEYIASFHANGDIMFNRLKERPGTPNLFIDEYNHLRIATTTSYTAEEVDEKLAKLSARLEELEKKLK